MKPAVRLALFAVALGAATGGGALVGWAVGPIDVDDDATTHEIPEPTGPEPASSLGEHPSWHSMPEAGHE